MAVRDVPVVVTAEEIEAEVIRSRLEAEGIPARIAPRSQLGVPASWSPRGLGYGAGSFAVRVPEHQVADARRVLGIGLAPANDDDGEDDGEVIARAPRPPLIRIVATVVLIAFLLAMLLPVAQLLGELR